MTIQELRELALHAVQGTAPANFTADNVNAAFADGLAEFAGSINMFMKNRYDLYEIIVENVDKVMPKRVLETIGLFAEIKTVPQGQKAVFKRKVGKGRAKKFLTQVGLSGVYETFRLDVETFELKAHAIGGGATIDFERMLDGTETLADVMEVITDGLTDAVYAEVQKALVAAHTAANRPAANKVTHNEFDATKMFKLVNVVRAYGEGATIFAAPEFVGEMGADAIGVNKYAEADINAIHETGYIRIFRGTPVVILPQSYVDENNEQTWLNPQFAYVLPTGGQKVVAVVLEGATQINDFKNRDNSMEVYAYKKMGCAIVSNHNWGTYQNTGITDTSYNPYN